MKKIAIVILSLILGKSGISQTLYPTPYQSLGSIGVAVRDTGGLFVRGTFVPPYYSDTTAANSANYVKNYAGSIIYTSDNKVWMRNVAKTRWIETGSGNISPNWLLYGNDVVSGQYLGSNNTVPFLLKANDTTVGFISDTLLTFGDVYGSFHDTKIDINDGDSDITLKCNGVVSIGDAAGYGRGTIFVVDDKVRSIRGITNKFGVGSGVNASGTYSTAFGYNTIASGYNSAAIGEAGVASGDFSTSMGSANTASGDYSTAMGRSNTVSGNQSVVIGSNLTNSQDSTIKLGFTTSNLSIKAGNNLSNTDSTAFLTTDENGELRLSVVSGSGGSTTLQEAYANGNRFDSNATQKMVGYNYTIDSVGVFKVNTTGGGTEIGYENGGVIFTDAAGAYAGGESQGGGIKSFNGGSFAYGGTVNGLISAGGAGGVAIGYADSDTLINAATGAGVFGRDNHNSGHYSYLIGRGLRNTVDNRIVLGNSEKNNLIIGANNLHNNISEDSVLTTDVDGNVKMKLAGGGGGSGTVTSVATGYGLSGGTITTSGTLLVDSATLSTKYVRRADSTVTFTTPTQTALKLNKADSVAGGYYPYSSNPLGYLTSSGITNKWSKTGDAGTTSGTNFLGTTDNQSLKFRTNNTQIAVFDSLGNVGIGNTSPQSKLDITTNGIGTTQTNTSGILLADTTDAASGLPQYSPALRFRGTAWKSNATAASQTIDYRQYLSTIGSSAAGIGKLLFDYSINGGSYTTTAVIGQSGVISSIGLVSNTSGFYLANSGFNVNSPSSSSAGGLVYQNPSIVSLYAANLYTLQLYADNQRFDNFTGEVMRINSNSNVLVGTSTNVPSAKFVVTSTTQGVRLPVMTTTQKNAISSPAEGLEVYDLTLHQKSYWNGSTWINY